MSNARKTQYHILEGNAPPPTRPGIEARQRILRELHGVALRTPMPRERWFLQDIRRGRRTMLGALLKFVDLAIDQGVDAETLNRIPSALRDYIEVSLQYRDAKRALWDGGGEPKRAA